MSVGLLVDRVTDSLPRNGDRPRATGFLAASAQDWTSYLEALRDSTMRRQVDLLLARDAVRERFSKGGQASRLVHVLRELHNDQTEDVE